MTLFEKRKEQIQRNIRICQQAIDELRFDETQINLLNHFNKSMKEYSEELQKLTQTNLFNNNN
jgi:hypothetical protein